MRWTCPQCSSEFELDDAPASCPQCGELKDTVAPASAYSDSATQRDDGNALHESIAAAETAHPSTIGPYHLQERLGGGGFGYVFRAVDSRSGAEVALKIPRRDRFRTATELRKFEKAFLREGQRTQQLTHPHIVRVIDVGQDAASGLPYIAMELLPGGTLCNWTKPTANISLDAILLVLEDVTHAIGCAHRRNIFHLDLKPGNIFLTEKKRAKVGDFGISLHEDELVRRSGAAGTLPYMSPEQLKGGLHVDGRTDIWSVGVILYELLAKRRPFEGNDSQLMTAIREKSVRPLRQRDLKVPEELDEICQRCLQKRPDDRYASAEELAAALRAVRRRSNRRVLIASAAGLAGLAGISFQRRRRGDELLEDQIEPHVPTDLPLDGLFGLRKLAWPHKELPSPVLSHDSLRRQVTVRTADLALVELGTTQCRTWQLETTLSKQENREHWSGLFFGYRPIANREPAQPRFQSLVVRMISKRGHSAVRLERRILELQWESDEDFNLVFPDGLRPTYVDLDGAVPENFHLQVEFRGGFLVSVQCNGQTCEGLGKRRELDLLSAPAFGAFGFYNYYGDSTFRATQVVIATS